VTVNGEKLVDWVTRLIAGEPFETRIAVDPLDRLTRAEPMLHPCRKQASVRRRPALPPWTTGERPTTVSVDYCNR
jgi:hypothetical protein